MLYCIFAVVAALLFPIAACTYFAVKKKAVRPVLLGVICFLFFQVFTRIPILQLVLPSFAFYQLFSNTKPVLYLLFLSVTAGVFEELGRYILYKLFLKEMTLLDAVAFGTAHGGTEAVLLVGVGAVLSLFVGGRHGGIELLYAGVERIFAIAAHICWSIMVWRSFKFKKPTLFAIAVLLHAAFDYVAAYAVFAGVGLLTVEGIIALMTFALLLYTVVIVKKNLEVPYYEKENDSSVQSLS